MRVTNELAWKSTLLDSLWYRNAVICFGFVSLFWRDSQKHLGFIELPSSMEKNPIRSHANPAMWCQQTESNWICWRWRRCCWWMFSSRRRSLSGAVERERGTQPDEAAWLSLPGLEEMSKQRHVWFKDCLQYERGKYTSNSQQYGSCEQVCWHACSSNTHQAWWRLHATWRLSDPIPGFASLPFLACWLDFQLLFFSRVWQVLSHGWPFNKIKTPPVMCACNYRC